MMWNEKKSVKIPISGDCFTGDMPLSLSCTMRDKLISFQRKPLKSFVTKNSRVVKLGSF